MPFQGDETVCSDIDIQLPQDHNNDWDDRSTVPESIEEGCVWIRRHPCSQIPSGFQTTTSQQGPSYSANMRPPEPNQPYHPFATFDDFDQARIFIRNGASDGQITEQLQHNARRYGVQGEGINRTPQSAKDLHKILARAITAENLKVCFNVIIHWIATDQAPACLCFLSH